MAGHELDGSLTGLVGAFVLYARRYGEEAALEWLNAEAARVRTAPPAMQPSPAPDRARSKLPPKPDTRDETIDALIEALRFYADSTLYRPGRGAKRALIVVDGGSGRARRWRNSKTMMADPQFAAG
jgi:hypothetical protein